MSEVRGTQDTWLGCKKPKMERTLEEWQRSICPLLTGINRYNPEIIATLEQYVQYQSEKKKYDFDANLTLMKLYQFRPKSVNITVALQILLKSLTNLPKTDFVVLKCVLPQSLQKDTSVQQVVALHSLLESCQFKQFWSTVSENKDVVQNVKDFEEEIRQYICSVIDVSYQSIELDLLQDYLGDTSGSVFTEIAQSRGWLVVNDGESSRQIVHIKKQESTIKPKKILAKIEFDSISGILSAAASQQ